MPVEGGYLYDFHYPCKKDGRLAAQVAFNIMLAHAKAVTAYRELALAGEIGVVLNLTPSYTLTDSDADKKPPGMPTCFFNRSFLDPLVKHEFPKALCEILAAHDCLPTTSKDDAALILSADIDFLGVNYYVPRRVKARESEYDLDYFHPGILFRKRGETRRASFLILIVITTRSCRRRSMTLPPIFAITTAILSGISRKSASRWIDNQEGEPGADGVINDTFRIQLMEEHLNAAAPGDSRRRELLWRVHQWTFIDNWSWINASSNGALRLLATGSWRPASDR